MKKTAIAFFLAALVSAVPFHTSAKDTDIYTKAPDMGRDDTPNVLIIFDTSGSMDSDAVTIKEPYDPAKTYTTYGDIKPGRIYWTYPDWKGVVNVPAHDTSKWFSATNNNCIVSTSILNTSGRFGSSPMVAYRGSSNGWGDFVAGKDYVVDCEADDETTDPNKYVNSSKTPMYTSNAAKQINWGGQKTPTLFTSNYMNWYYTTPTTTKTRLEVAKEVINNIIQSNPGMRFGLMTFNSNGSSGPHGGRVVFSVDNMTTARTTGMTSVVNSLVASGYTPLAETMWEAYTYLAGKNVDFGNDATNPTPPRDLTAEDATGKYITPFKYECQEGYIIYMTDGDPTNDNDADARIAALPGIDVKNSGTKTGYTDTSYLDELAKWMYNHDVTTGKTLTTNKGRRVSTYTIGFGQGISASGKQLLQDTATKGNGKYYTADNADQLTAAFQGALTEILKVTASFVAPALSVNAFNTLFNRDEVYFALFKASSTVCWNGNIKKFAVCNGKEGTGCSFGEVVDKNGVPAVDKLTSKVKDSATSYWSSSPDGNEVTKGGAGANFPAPASRKIYTYTGGYSTAGIPTGTTDLTNSINAVDDTNVDFLTATMLGVPTGTGTEATDRTKVINWMHGVDSFDEDADGDDVEVRSWSFADPLHSRPVAVTYGGDTKNPIIKLFVGTNDGGIRMINESTGEEEWVFYPKEVLGLQYLLAKNDSGDHLWGMDGTPRFRIKDQTSATDPMPDGIIDPSIGDYVQLYIGMRRGGRNIYSLDVTPGAKVTTQNVGQIQPKLRWVIQGGVTTGFDNLGQTWSDPVITRIRYSAGGQDTVMKPVLVFGGGYDDSQDTIKPSDPYGTDDLGNAIYIVDPENGSRIWWASGTGSGANLVLDGMDFAIPSEITTMDSDGDGATDRLYVGDLGGQIWRIDLSSTLKAGSNGDPATTGYRFADLGCTAGSRPACTGTPAQDRRKFFYRPDVAQIYDSTYEDTAESKHDLVTIVSGDREDPLDFLTDPAEPVHNRIYVLRDYRYKTGPLDVAASETYKPTIHDKDLFDATSNPLQNEGADTSSIKLKKGWYIDLVDGNGKWIGEKGLAKTGIFAGQLMVTTFTPANETSAAEKCKPNEGDATTYFLNVLNGAAVTDFDGDGTLDRKLDVGGGIPSEVITIIRPGGVSKLIGPANPPVPPPPPPRTKTYWSQ